MEILRYKDLVDAPWKNGGGITRNIAQGMNRSQIAWRLSRADVAQNGAFSSFDGLERILTVVSDTGMALAYPGGALDAQPWHPVRFSGALDVASRLYDGPLTDLNLMFDPRICDGTVATLRGPLAQLCATPDFGITALHVLAGRPVLDDVQLGVGDTMFFDKASPLTLDKGDAVLQIDVRYLDHSNAITLCIAER